MKTTFLRTLLACGSLMIVPSFAAAEQSGIGSLFNRWTGAPPQQATDLDVAVDAYSDEDVMEDMPPAEPPSSGKTSCDGYDSCDAGCTSGVDCGEHCSGDPCGGCRSCDVCTSGCGSTCSLCDGCACDTCGECCSGGCGCDCESCGCDSCCGNCCQGGMHGGIYYAEIQNIFMRTHVSEQLVGKLREKYEWSPRLVLGYESPNGLGGRVRRWSYSRTNSTLDTGQSFHMDLDVMDLEGTARFSSKRADLVIASGLRYADFDIEDDGGDRVDADLPGMTFAADGRMAICCVGCSQWSGVCGARWSLLGGNWEGDGNDLMDEVRDDNITVQEIYGGFEYLSHRGNYDLYARLVFEMQNWHSDVLGATGDAESIGFVGPAIHCGVSF